jgi:hypothetical protein
MIEDLETSETPAEDAADKSPTALTDWENEPTIQDLTQDLTDSASDHDEHVSTVDTWLDNLKVEGKAQPKKVEGRSSVQPKLIRKQAEWRYSSLSEPFLSTEDIFNVAPVTAEDRNAAIQNGLVLNNQFNTKIQKVKFINDYVRTAVDEGTVVVRVGWDFEEEEREVEVPLFDYRVTNDPAIIQRQEALHQLVTQNPNALNTAPEEWVKAYNLSVKTGLPHEPVPAGTETQTKTVTVKNQPSLEVCDYRNVTIDPTCLGDISKAEFIIYSFETNLSELEKDGKYVNLDQININTNSILSAPDHDTEESSLTFNFSDKPRKKFVAYEYWGFWDIHNTGVAESFIATWVGDTMIRMESNPFPNKELPFITAQYLPIRRSIYGEPDGELLEDNQKIVGAVTRGMIDIMGRSANGQQGVRKDALDITNKRKFDRGLDYEFNAQVDPRQAFYMHTFPEIPASAPTMLQYQNQDAESLTGVKAFSEGITGSALGDNVGGIRSALDATAKRELDILRRLAEGIKQIGRKVISMNGEFLEEEEIIRITDEEFVPVKRDDLAGNIDLTLSISTPEADNEKAKELAFMLQTTAQTMGNDFAQLILSNIARLRKMPALAKQIEEFQPTPDPLQQQIQMLEIEKLKAEITKLNSEAEENSAEAALDRAKAGNTQSDTDNKNLDFVEQESGTTHARDVDRITSQAESQARTKVIDNLTKPVAKAS